MSALVVTDQRSRSTKEEHRFSAMGTFVQVLVVGGRHGLVRDAEARIDELESMWSRFRADSEVSLVNRLGSKRPVKVSPPTLQLIDRACLGWRLSEGAFDPTVLGAMHAAGYANSFAGSTCSPRAASDPQAAPGCGGIMIDRSTSTVRLDEGVGLDLGGIGKGFAADLVVNEISRAGAAGVLVNIGGDLVARGETGEPGGWTVSIIEPSVSSEPFGTVAFDEGAVATSSAAKRRWETNLGRRHHLIDPETGASRVGGPLLVSALACEGWLAEVTTKSLMAGQPAAAGLASVPSLAVSEEGQVRLFAGMGEYLS
ncbi:MAG: FAD:protein FMN transferase [Acidimicrobiales bacterium]